MSSCCFVEGLKVRLAPRTFEVDSSIYELGFELQLMESCNFGRACSSTLLQERLRASRIQIRFSTTFARESGEWSRGKGRFEKSISKLTIHRDLVARSSGNPAAKSAQRGDRFIFHPPSERARGDRRAMQPNTASADRFLPEFVGISSHP